MSVSGTAGEVALPVPRSRRRWLSPASLAGVLVLAVLTPFLVEPIYVHLGITVMIAAIFALSFNVLYGYGGLPSFGHAAYYGLGAYTIGMGMAKWDWPFWFTLVMAPVIAGVGAFVIGVFCVRLRIIYFAMLTMAFSQLLYFLVQQSYDITDGDNGVRVTGVPEALQSTAHPDTFFYVTLVVTVVCVALLYLIMHSPFGYALKAMRENPRRAEAVGLRVSRYQLTAFVIAGVFAGIAGALYGVFALYVFPKLFFWDKGAEPLLMAILGGVGSFLGPVVGAVAYQLLYFFVARDSEYVKLVIGSIIILTVLVAPRGIVGLLGDGWDVARGKKPLKLPAPLRRLAGDRFLAGPTQVEAPGEKQP